jgi:hypothetical protein
MKTSVQPTMVMCLFCAVLLGMILCLPGLAWSAESTPASTQPSEPATQTQPAGDGQAAPPQLIEAYVKAVKERGLYKLLSNVVSVEAVHKIAPDWELEKTSFLENIRGIGFSLPDGQTCLLVNISPEQLTLDVGRGQHRTKYVVSPKDMKDLQFQYVYSLVLVDPSNKPIERFVVDSEPIKDVAAKLCKLGDLDLVMPAKPLDMNLISLDLRNKSASECLQYAVRAAGLMMEVDQPKGLNWWDNEGSGRKPGVLDAFVDVYGIVSEDIASHSDGTASAALDAIKEEAARVAKIVTTNRPVIIIKEPSQEQKSKPDK